MTVVRQGTTSRGSRPAARLPRTFLAVGAILLGTAACAPRPAPQAVRGPLDPPALQAAWAATLSDVRAELERGRYASADSALNSFLTEHPDTPQGAEALFWRAVVKLDPANANGSPREALVAVDAYIARGSGVPNFELAQVIRRTAGAMEAFEPLPEEPAVKPPANHDSTERARSAEEIARLKAELEKVNAELERIKKRIRPGD